MKIEVKGAIISNDEKWIYDLFEMDSTAPKDILLPTNGEKVEVVINSGGGNVYAGSEIYTALRNYNGPVTVDVVGIAASAASVIAMAGDHVRISPTAQIMIHNVSSAVRGDHNTFEKEANVLKNYNTSIANAYTAKTGKNMDELLALMDEETWFTADQAVEQGFADEVMFTNEKAPQLVASLSPVIPQNAIDKLMDKLTPKFDMDSVVNAVVEKLNKQEERIDDKPRKNGFERFFF